MFSKNFLTGLEAGLSKKAGLKDSIMKALDKSGIYRKTVAKNYHPIGQFSIGNNKILTPISFGDDGFKLMDVRRHEPGALLSIFGKKIKL